jgi:hypothetical protein
MADTIDELNNITEINHVKIITVGVMCTWCGNTWGIKLHNDKKGLEQLLIISKRFICDRCLRNKTEKPEQNLY